MGAVILVDDHPLIRQGLAYLLMRQGWTVAAEVSLASGVKPAMLTHPWDITILDVQLPDQDGIELLQSLRKEGILGPVLIHSQLSEASIGTRAFKAGANGVIHKGCDPTELWRAIELVAGGQHYASPNLVGELVGNMAGKPASQPHDILSDREYQVLCQIGYGKQPQEIAEILGCSPNTISTYRARILQKLKLKNSMEIMRYAISNRLIQI